MAAARRTVPAPELVEVASGVYAYVQPDGGWMLNNTGVLVNRDGSHVMVDTTSTEARNRALLAAVGGAAAGTALRALINTHHHGDHTFGNWLVPEGVPIIGHVHCREDVLDAGLIAARAFPGPDYGRIELRPPDIAFADRLELHFGERAVRLVHVGPAHTRGDVIVWLPAERIVFSGDLVFNGGQPFLVEGSLRGYPPALQVIRDLDPEVLVPGHGPVCRGEEVGRILDRLTGYATWLDALAREGHAAGRAPLAVAQAADLGEYATWREGERLVGNLHRAYSELDGNPLGTKIPISEVREEMIALHGGPIECLA